MTIEYFIEEFCTPNAKSLTVILYSGLTKLRDRGDDRAIRALSRLDGKQGGWSINDFLREAVYHGILKPDYFDLENNCRPGTEPEEGEVD